MQNGRKVALLRSNCRQGPLFRPNQFRTGNRNSRAGAVVRGFVHRQQAPRLSELFRGVGGDLLEMIGKAAAQFLKRGVVE